jgi:hypothetical protein
MKKCYEWTDKSGRTYYKAIYWLEGKRVQRTLRSRDEAIAWYDKMVETYGPNASDVEVPESKRYHSHWWRFEFTPTYCNTGMMVVPGHRCKNYWTCLFQPICLSAAAKLDWPGWAEVETALKFYNKEVKQSAKDLCSE